MDKSVVGTGQARQEVDIVAGYVEVVMRVQSGTKVRSILFRGLSRFFFFSFFFTFVVILNLFSHSITDDVAARPRARLTAYCYISIPARDAETGGQRRAGKSDCKESIVPTGSTVKRAMRRYERVVAYCWCCCCSWCCIGLWRCCWCCCCSCCCCCRCCSCCCNCCRHCCCCAFIYFCFIWQISSFWQRTRVFQSLRFFFVCFFFFAFFAMFCEFRLDNSNLSIVVDRPCVPPLRQRRVQEGSNAIEQIHGCSVIFLSGK